MCGIAGILHFRNSAETPDVDLVRRMAESLRHRGPDDNGIWSSNGVAFGHRRLSIIDLSSHGHQPMHNEDERITIAYNGEVYNFRELKIEFSLVERGHQFRSRTDSEVLIHLFEEIGLEMLPKLNGMFAFALWDDRSKQLHLARDRAGIKPLFYTKQHDRLIFASEIKAILEDPGVERRVNLQAMHDFLTFNYIPGVQTAFEGIFEVPPAHVLTVNLDGEVRLRRYWEPSYKVDESLTEENAAEIAYQLMDQAVERQLVSDVPVGVFLSGGLDSSAITALMAQRKTEPIHTFSLGFEERSFNELPFARIMAERFGTIHREVVVTAELVRDMLPQYLSFVDEPYADGAAIPTYYISKLAREDVTVVLSGEGGDEAFAGYDTHAAYQVSRLFKRVPKFIRNGLLSPLVNRLPVSHSKLSLEFKMKRFLGGQDLSVPEAHMWWRIVLDEAQKLELYNPAMLESFVPQRSARFFVDRFEESEATNDLNRLLHIDSSVFLPDDLMVKNDRMSMANSLEARVPFTDNDLMAFMETVPPNMKLKGLRKKNLMRRALKGTLPQEILDKKKVGLEMPYSKWFRGELRELLLDYCAPSQLADIGLFQASAIGKLIDQHLAGTRDHGRALWGILNFLMWFEMYIANPVAGFRPHLSGLNERPSPAGSNSLSI